MKYRYLEVISTAFDIDNVQKSPLIKAIRGRLQVLYSYDDMTTHTQGRVSRRITVEEANVSSARAA